MMMKQTDNSPVYRTINMSANLTRFVCFGRFCLKYFIQYAFMLKLYNNMATAKIHSMSVCFMCLTHVILCKLRYSHKEEEGKIIEQNVT